MQLSEGSRFQREGTASAKPCSRNKLGVLKDGNYSQQGLIVVTRGRLGDEA